MMSRLRIPANAKMMRRFSSFGSGAQSHTFYHKDLHIERATVLKKKPDADFQY